MVRNDSTDETTVHVGLPENFILIDGPDSFVVPAGGTKEFNVAFKAPEYQFSPIQCFRGLIDISPSYHVITDPEDLGVEACSQGTAVINAGKSNIEYLDTFHRINATLFMDKATTLPAVLHWNFESAPNTPNVPPKGFKIREVLYFHNDSPDYHLKPENSPLSGFMPRADLTDWVDAGGFVGPGILGPDGEFHISNCKVELPHITLPPPWKYKAAIWTYPGVNTMVSEKNPAEGPYEGEYRLVDGHSIGPLDTDAIAQGLQGGYTINQHYEWTADYLKGEECQSWWPMVTGNLVNVNILQDTIKKRVYINNSRWRAEIVSKQAGALSYNLDYIEAKIITDNLLRGINLSWQNDTSVLQEADSPAGPWNNVTGGKSKSVRVSDSAGQKFYRLLVQ